MRCALAALSVALAAAAAGQGFADSVERERAVRAQALDPAGPAALRTALDDPSWERRAAALDALARSRRAGVEPAGDPRALDAELDARFAAAGAPASMHPNVLAAWIDAYAACGRPGPVAAKLEGVRVDALVSPDVRAALLALAPRSTAVAAAVRPLAADPDDAIAARAAAWLDPLAAIERDPVSPTALRAALAVERDVARRGAGGLAERAGRARAASPEAAALLAALALVVDGQAALEPLADGWVALTGRSRRARALALRAATCGGDELARAWLARADRTAGAPDAWVEGALAAVGPARAFALARELGAGPDVVAALIEAAAGRDEPAVGEALARWLEPGAPAAVRAAAAELCARRLLAFGDRAAGDLLAARLDDPDGDLAALARRALLGSDDPTRWEPALFAHAQTLGDADRRALLARMPRHVAWARFRADLLERGEARPAERVALAGLLAAFAGDEAVAAALRRWLVEEDVALRAAAARGEEPGAAVARGRALVLALAAVDPEAVDAFARTAEASAGLEAAAEDVAKHALAALARSAVGRARLPRFLADEGLATRARIEAALGLAPGGDRAAAVYLIERFETCDWELRERVMAAFAGRTDALTRAFLARVATSDASVPEDRVSAVSALGARPEPEATAALADVLARTADLDAVHAAVRALGGRSDAASRAQVRELVAHVESGAPLERSDLFAGVGGPASAFGPGELRETLLLARAAHAELGAAEVDALWRRPRADAAPDLRTRFRGGRLVKAAFRFRGELALAGAAADQALTDVFRPGWEACDARFLLALAETFERGEGPANAETAERLACAAVVGLAGEAPTAERDDALLAARLARLRLAERRGRWEVYERLVRDLADDRRRDAVPDEAFERALGAFDARLGVDPVGRLAQAAPTARGLAALARGDAAAARRELEAGRAVPSRSRAGAAALDALAAALETPERSGD